MTTDTQPVVAQRVLIAYFRDYDGNTWTHRFQLSDDFAGDHWFESFESLEGEQRASTPDFIVIQTGAKDVIMIKADHFVCLETLYEPR